MKLEGATVENVLELLPMVHASIGDFVVGLGIYSGEGISSRTFTVPDNRLAINDSMIIDKTKQTYDVRPLFEAKGVQFPPGTSAVYTLPTKSLTVVLVESEDIIRIEELLVFGFKNVK